MICRYRMRKGQQNAVGRWIERVDGNHRLWLGPANAGLLVAVPVSVRFESCVSGLPPVFFLPRNRETKGGTVRSDGLFATYVRIHDCDIAVERNTQDTFRSAFFTTALGV